VVIVIVAIVIPPVMVAIPTVVVLHTPAFTVPVANVIVSAFPAGSDPACRRVGDARPVAVVPLIVVAYGVPVAFNPHKIGAGSNRTDSHHTRRRRSSDGDSNRYLSGTSGDCEKNESR